MLIININDREALEAECEFRQRTGTCPRSGCWKCDIELRLHDFDREMDEPPKRRRRRKVVEK